MSSKTSVCRCVLSQITSENRKDSLTFFRAWLKDPRGVASAVPSSLQLAEMITREIGPATAPVIELGPGTGVFTRALLQRGIPVDKLMLIERDPVFSKMLSERFPKAHLFSIDATQLRHSPSLQAGAVLSGLPLLWMPRRAVLQILKGAASHLRPGGGIYQFTYMPCCPVPASLLARLDLKARRVGTTALNNLPPATVYCFEKHSDVDRS